MIDKEILEQIRKNESAFDLLFSEEYRFSAHLHKQKDDQLPDMYHHNAFITDGIPDEKELLAAEKFQKENDADFLLIKSKKRLPSALTERFRLEEDRTDTMILKTESFRQWKRNSAVTIKDLKKTDIAKDLLETELKNYGAAYGEDFVRRKMHRYLEASKKHDGFHYFGAYIGETIAGACYVFVSDGCACIDGLVVNEEYRKQYVATTLLSHIVKNFGKNVFLHADANDTPKEMYTRMGFTIIDKVYEYNYEEEP